MLVVRQEQDLGAGGTGRQHWEQTGRSGKQEGRCWGQGQEEETGEGCWLQAGAEGGFGGG